MPRKRKSTRTRKGPAGPSAVAQCRIEARNRALQAAAARKVAEEASVASTGEKHASVDSSVAKVASAPRKQGAKSIVDWLPYPFLLTILGADMLVLSLFGQALKEHQGVLNMLIFAGLSTGLFLIAKGFKTLVHLSRRSQNAAIFQNRLG